MIKKAATLLLLLLLLSLAREAGAQSSANTQSNKAEQSKAQTVDEETADLVITAHVTARELTFEAVPNPRVEFTGKPARQTEWSAERENLPRPVEPGVTYRNVGIRLKIVSRFADIERIVAEALGEVPINDELPQDRDAEPPEKAPTASPSSTQAQAPAEAARP